MSFSERVGEFLDGVAQGATFSEELDLIIRSDAPWPEKLERIEASDNRQELKRELLGTFGQDAVQLNSLLNPLLASWNRNTLGEGAVQSNFLRMHKAANDAERKAKPRRVIFQKWPATKGDVFFMKNIDGLANQRMMEQFQRLAGKVDFERGKVLLNHAMLHRLEYRRAGVPTAKLLQTSDVIAAVEGSKEMPDFDVYRRIHGFVMNSTGWLEYAGPGEIGARRHLRQPADIPARPSGVGPSI